MAFKTVAREFIFGEDRPFNSCHASTLLVLPDRTVVAAWFGGTREGAEDVSIWLAKRENGTWSSPKKISVHENIPHWNPVLFQSASGRIFLFYKVGHHIPEWYTMLTTSDDGGSTWTEPRVLVEGDIGGRGPVKNKIIKLSDGTWLAPASLESKNWDAFVDISYDEGLTWHKSCSVPLKRCEYEYKNDSDKLNTQVPVFKGQGVIQPTLWESEPGTVHMLLRSTEGCIYRSDSKDAGKTWSQAYPTSLPNNNSGIDLTRLDNGMLVLVYNPVDINWGPRSPLVVSTSCDNAKTWKDTFVLENDKDCEFSYPAIVSKGNEIFISYTWKRERIAYWNLLIE